MQSLFFVSNIFAPITIRCNQSVHLIRCVCVEERTRVFQRGFKKKKKTQNTHAHTLSHTHIHKMSADMMLKGLAPTEETATV